MWIKPFLAVAVGCLLQATAFRSEARLVVLHVTVRNTHGDLVTNLGQDAFTVYENGKRQTISIFRRDDIPVSIGLLIDNSGSMRSVQDSVEKAALAFADASNPDDELFVISFADKPRLDVPFTSDRALLERNIRRTDAIGGTAMRDAAEQAEQYLRDSGSRDRRALVIVTDGNDNASSVSLDQITKVAQQRDIVIYAIGLFGHVENSNAARAALDHLAERSGGIAYYPSSIDAIDAVARDIAHQIRNQYTLAYAPLNQALDGSYRTIQVRVIGQDRYYPRTRTGYLATP